jgi:lysophospholipase L1-like esterase
MPDDERVQLALAQGSRRAVEVLEFRSRQLVVRETAIEQAIATELPLREEAVTAPAVFEAAGRPARGVLVAEGDSWFDYPMTDVLRVLEDLFGYDVDSVAHKGDRVEEMAYGGGQLEELTRAIEKLLRRGVVPRAILLSGGGNDLAGREFGMLLNHHDSPVPGLNARILAGIFDERIKLAYISILQAVTRICEAKVGRAIPIVLHGYDHPVPDGRGFLGGWWFLPGPWLEPGFREKGYMNLGERITLAAELIDQFNATLASIVTLPAFAHVRYVDLRGTLSNAPGNYAEFWANELHPTVKGFELVANRLAAAL